MLCVSSTWPSASCRTYDRAPWRTPTRPHVRDAECSPGPAPRPPASAPSVSTFLDGQRVELLGAEAAARGAGPGERSAATTWGRGGVHPWAGAQALQKTDGQA